jgi:hyperosmotically inducible periplasmic protein
MKKLFTNTALVVLLGLSAVACKKKPNDADLQTKAAAVQVAYPQAQVEIKEGVAHVKGTFADQAAKDKFMADIKAIEGVKETMDHSEIAPVAAATTSAPVATTSAVDPAIIQKVNDAIKDIPGIKAEVIEGELSITGAVSKEDARKVKQSVDALKVGKVNYKYSVK